MNETTIPPGQTAALLSGKFKDAAALERAYRALEAEFTKRCQRLRALEQAQAAPQAPDDSAPQEPDANEPPATAQSVAVQAKAVQPAPLETVTVQKVQPAPLEAVTVQKVQPAPLEAVTVQAIQPAPQQTVTVQATAQSAPPNPAVQPVPQRTVTVTTDASVPPSPVPVPPVPAPPIPVQTVSVPADPSAVLSDPEVFERLVSDERLAGAVIARYLNALQRAAAPPTMGGAAGAIALTPAHRPRTLAECKTLADKYL